MQEWDLVAPDPPRYEYRPSLTAHPFMGLPKFYTGRLQQMRSGKSYLRAHPSWANAGPPDCPSCNEAHETFEYAILDCSAKRPARSRHLQGVTELGPDAPIWSSGALLAALTRFTRCPATAIPTGMFSRPSCWADSVSSHSSKVLSFRYFLWSQES